VIQLSGAVVMWLVTCHDDETVVVQISVRFERIFDLLRRSGTAIGMPSVRQIHGYEGLWEMRVRHRTGAYRLFFGIKGNVIAVASGERKTAERFPPSVYKRAKAAVDEFLGTIEIPGGQP
jgi:hypothetical protein